MARAEILQRKQVLMALPYFTEGLSAYVEARHLEKKPADLAMVTYHRVGEGLFESRMLRGADSVVSLFQGQLDIGVSLDTIFSMTAGLFDMGLKLLTTEQIKDYYAMVGDELGRMIPRLHKPTFFVVYGGEGVKFQIALNLIYRLSSWAQATGKLSLANFYLLTCGCGGLTEKANRASALHSEGRLKAVIYNPAGCNGGNRDTAAITNTFLGYPWSEVK